MAKLKIGYNPAANMLPMFYFFNSDQFELFPDVPAGHNRLMAQGQIDMAPISAFSYGEHWHEYSVLRDLSVSAKGKIGSILLYSKYELKNLDGRRVALTNTSATSVNLLKVILHRFYNISPQYITMAPKLESMLSDCDAALLIADEALMGLRGNFEGQIYDLGAEWYKHTGLPMTFSVWAVTNKACQYSPKDVGKAHTKLLESKILGLANKDQIINHCIANLGYDHNFWSDYFSQLRYDLDSELLAGLDTYFAYCTELGLLPSRPTINLWPKQD